MTTTRPALTDAFRPTCLLSETHFTLRPTEDEFTDAALRVIDDGFYRAVEIGAIEKESNRRRIRHAVETHNISLTVWCTPTLIAESLNPSAIDEPLRVKTLARLSICLDQAAECGAKGLGLFSGPDPGPDLRGHATEQLYSTLRQLCQDAWNAGEMRVYLEPMDRGAHKNGLIGPTDELVELISRLRRHHANIGICWDSAHAALNREDILESITASSPYIYQVHISNAILDPTSPKFGDLHMPIGKPGFMTVEKAAEIFRRAIQTEIFGPRLPNVAVEVRTTEGDPWATLDQCTKVLTEAWNLATAVGED